jgi:hypothetical protein
MDLSLILIQDILIQDIQILKTVQDIILESNVTPIHQFTIISKLILHMQSNLLSNCYKNTQKSIKYPLKLI